MSEEEAELVCLFCGRLIGRDAIHDENGEVACKTCGEAELRTQEAERLSEKLT